MSSKKSKESIQELLKRKNEKIMDAVDRMTSYYRQNPHKFVKEYLHVDLKLFQKIILYQMVKNNYTIYIAARG